ASSLKGRRREEDGLREVRTPVARRALRRAGRAHVRRGQAARVGVRALLVGPRWHAWYAPLDRAAAPAGARRARGSDPRRGARGAEGRSDPEPVPAEPFVGGALGDAPADGDGGRVPPHDRIERVPLAREARRGALLERVGDDGRNAG